MVCRGKFFVFEFFLFFLYQLYFFRLNFRHRSCGWIAGSCGS
jgi:hypothetical protein